MNLWKLLLWVLVFNCLLSVLAERRLSKRIDCIISALDATDDVETNVSDLCPKNP